MQLKLEIGYKQLLELAKQLPKVDFIQFRKEINQITFEEGTELNAENKKLLELLKNGPVWTEKDVEYIHENRNQIDTWRGKRH